MSKKFTKLTGIGSQLPLAMRTGKYVAGFEQTLESVVKKTARCLVIASNLPEGMRRQLEYYCVLANNIPIKFYEGSNNELSVLAGLKFRTSVISILDQGESDLIEVKEN